jgi:16S rRNA (guanine966-N2)-methyltransferase
MRVIAGAAKGRRLAAPRGMDVRPTADRVKESLFNILPRDWSGSTVLDLFSGSGNLAIEALSRGAAHALLIDVSARAAAVIRENLRRSGMEGRAQLWIAPVARTLKSLGGRGKKFTIIFLDPPYATGLTGQSLQLIARYDLLEQHGTIAVEHSNRESVDPFYGGLELHDQRQYGDTLLSFYQHTDKPPARKGPL